MEVASLGFRTDLMLRRLGGSTIDDHGDHLVVRTPDNPTFYWGNFLLLAEPPDDGGARWLDVFAREYPTARHVTIGIDGVDGDLGDVSALTAAGLEVENDVVLTAESLTGATSSADGVEVRRLTSDDDWAQTMMLRLILDEDDGDEHRAFVERKLAEARRLADLGVGAYFGAVIDGRVVASLGIYTDGGGLARYQNVETHPDYRRRGLASRLLVVAADAAVDELGATRLVIVADPDYVAVGLYRALGFVDAERQVQLQRAPTRTPPPTATAAAE